MDTILKSPTIKRKFRHGHLKKCSIFICLTNTCLERYYLLFHRSLEFLMFLKYNSIGVSNPMYSKWYPNQARIFPPCCYNIYDLYNRKKKENTGVVSSSPAEGYVDCFAAEI